MKGVKKVRQNDSFINNTCAFCGGVDVDGKALSEIQIICGYGSKNDSDKSIKPICGKCADRLYKIIQNERK